jgi:hemerythrin
MSLFTWKDDYSVHVEELDNHHKALFDIVNRLYENCLDVDNVNCLDPILDELISYSKYHFSVEEQYMTYTGFGEVQRHTVMHRAFARKMLGLRQQTDKNDLEQTKELIVFLGNWLLHHVLEEDKRYT